MVDGVMGLLLVWVRIQHLYGSLSLGILCVPVATREVVLVRSGWRHWRQSAVSIDLVLRLPRDSRLQCCLLLRVCGLCWRGCPWLLLLCAEHARKVVELARLSLVVAEVVMLWPMVVASVPTKLVVVW